MQPKLKPLAEWICDECGQRIRSASDGWLEWIHEPAPGGGYRTRSIRIVHHAPVSPRQPNADCYGLDGEEHESSMHLNYFTPTEAGPSGLMHVLESLVGDPRDRDTAVHAQELAVILRRLYVPYYEEARLYFDRVAPDRVPNVDRLLEVLSEVDESDDVTPPA